MKKISAQFKGLSNLDIIVAGKTGVGKSTLINSVFKGEFATTGYGRPVTRHLHQYTKKDIPLTIYDTRGMELDKEV